ncbi:hypothetical protein psyc5s11_30030 [Clostridium gelidum]|uniref:Uncharacterized protein n=1 Tax=Clostridium gelidum TaxID=704125 RepID=A0ABM7T4S8_9CLOT|nr:hypothetical protein [Clostridium gelidum]BCZ46936.1 hypothetical protein psyc5s11_30030 [Clostridium gelidum]
MPSQIINLTNEYEAFCFDEACSYILNELGKEDAKEPKFDVDVPNNNDDLIDFFKFNNNQ